MSIVTCQFNYVSCHISFDKFSTTREMVTRISSWRFNCCRKKEKNMYIRVYRTRVYTCNIYTLVYSGLDFFLIPTKILRINIYNALPAHRRRRERERERERNVYLYFLLDYFFIAVIKIFKGYICFITLNRALRKFHFYSYILLLYRHFL